VLLLGFSVFGGSADAAAASASKSGAKGKSGTTAAKKAKKTRTATVTRATKTRTTTVKRTKKTRKSTRLARARRARLARARAAAARAQWLELQTPRFKLDETGALVPDVRAEAAIIYDPQSGQVLWEENSQNKRSIASITKVMTAAVFLENSPDLTEEVVVERSDTRGANHTYLRARERVSLDDLLHLTLIASDNAAARALARVWPDGSSAFIERMNEKALELGLESTSYTDPSGLDAANVSSAYDMARLIAYAAGDERIASIMRKPHYTARTNRRVIAIHSTNQLVMKGDVDVRGGKTGFIRKAGYCLATLLRLPQTNQQVAVVVLGARSNAGRFMETRHLFNWLSGKAQDLFTSDSEPTPVAASPDLLQP
jgi:D-alanyl-D-alanine endopeptidase (penicillin-binding protein 7)